MAWTHRMLSVDRASKTGVCANCGTVDIVWRPRSGTHSGRWQCVVARRTQRHRTGESHGVHKSRSTKLDHCESCRVRPSPRAAAILKLWRGLTLCANCRALLKADSALFINSLNPLVLNKYDVWMRKRKKL